MSAESHNNLIQVAKITKSNGTDGQLVMSFRDIYPEDLDTNEPVFIYFDGLPVPYFVNELIPRGINKALVRLTDIVSGEDAEEVAGQAVYVDKSQIEEDEQEEDYSFLEGWTVIDASNGNALGTVSAFVDIPGNPCIELDKNNGAVMIPLHDDLIESIDEEKLCIKLFIPEGLL